MELAIRILKKHYRDEETGKVLGKFQVQQANGKNSWKTLKEFEHTRLEAAQAYAKNFTKEVPEDKVLKLW